MCNLKRVGLLTLLLVSAIFFNQKAFSQQYFGQQNCNHQGCEHGIQGTGEDKFTYVRPPAHFEPGAERAANIIVNYSGFSAPAQNAFQYAVDIWASFLTSPVTIEINANFANLGGGILGSAGPENFHRNFAGATSNNRYYPAALADKLSGFDRDNGNADISCNFNNTTNWYYGTDGNTPGGQYDFVTVVLHELGHGLGFVAGVNYNGNTGTANYNLFDGTPSIYTSYLEIANGTPLLNLANNTTAVGNALTSNQLYWGGPIAGANNQGVRPRMYAPGNYSGGSSISHLNEGTYGAGNINSLMTPAVGTAEAIHDPGPIVAGIFEDMGWSLDDDCGIQELAVAGMSACNGSNEYFVTIEVTFNDPPFSGDLVVNGVAVPVGTSPQLVQVSGLPADGLPVSINAFFSEEPECALEVQGLFIAPDPCCAEIRMSQIDTDNNTVSLTNYGVCSGSADLFSISDGTNVDVFSELVLISGADPIEIGETATYALANIDLSATNNVGLFDDEELPPYSTIDILDYVQWGVAGGSLQGIAVARGLWITNTIVQNLSPYNYVGDGTQDGSIFWQGTFPPCQFLGLSVLSQTACDEATNTFSVQVQVEYDQAPASGTLNVLDDNGAGVMVSITSSPQIVTLVLPSNGEVSNITATFSADDSCDIALQDAFTAPERCCTLLRMSEINLSNGRISLRNFSSCVQDITEYLLTDGTVSQQLELADIVFGDQFLNPAEQLVVNWQGTLPMQGQLALIRSGTTAPYVAGDVLDYAQWTGAGGSLESIAVADGLWDAGGFIADATPFSFEGDATDYGAEFWSGTAIPCQINDISVTAMPSCIGETGGAFYGVTVSFESAPTLGSLDFNGVQQPVGSSPITFQIFQPNATGQLLDGTAFFTLQPACSFTVQDLIQFPDCTASDCIGDLDSNDMVNISDLLALISDLGCAGANCAGDVNSDDATNIQDLLAIVGILGTDCP